ncbi:hypothetical protein KIN20_013587 [Parelaphostrongylus tenuis]|uniref:Uncharacterized protein n=1 Tax=Parelaphostrongylus tenuis TaxID=148309 RepID=A0AAD5MYB6_PARTN|nr:hypothetical protein KIN20_013587 [Parelaphostrongylus tenuis]
MAEILNFEELFNGPTLPTTNNLHADITQHAQCPDQPLLIYVDRYVTVYKGQYMSFALFTNALVFYGRR